MEHGFRSQQRWGLGRSYRGCKLLIIQWLNLFFRSQLSWLPRSPTLCEPGGELSKKAGERRRSPGHPSAEGIPDRRRETHGTIAVTLISRPANAADERL